MKKYKFNKYTNFLFADPADFGQFVFPQLPVPFKITVAMAFASILFAVAGCGKNQSPKFNQYYVQGEELYLKHCSNCHQKTGSGLGRVYPPLDTSDFMDLHFEEVICLIKFGRQGPMIVNGQQFNQPMQGINTLSDLEIAEIATYIYNTWSHERGMIEVREVTKILETCETQD